MNRVLAAAGGAAFAAALLVLLFLRAPDRSPVAAPVDAGRAGAAAGGSSIRARS